MARLTAVADFIRVESLAEAGDEALGSALLAYAARYKATKPSLALPGILASMTGGVAFDSEVGAFRFLGREFGPWRMEFRSLSAQDAHAGELGTLLVMPFRKKQIAASRGSGSIRGRLLFLYASARSMTDPVFGKVDAASLGTALRNFVTAIELQYGTQKATLIGFSMVDLLCGAVSSNAGSVRLVASDVEANGISYGNWTLSLCRGEPVLSDIRPMESASIGDRSGYAAARRFMRIVDASGGLDSISTSHRKNADGQWVIDKVSVRKEMEVASSDITQEVEIRRP